MSIPAPIPLFQIWMSTDWLSSSTPVPLHGIVFDADSGLYKIGNGVSTYAELPFPVSAGGSGGGSGSSGPPTTQTLTPSNGVVSVTVANSAAFKLTLGANATLNINSTAPLNSFLTLAFEVIQGGSGGYQVILPSNAEWMGGYIPGFSPNAGAKDILQLISFDGGVTWLASIAGQWPPVSP